MYIGLHNKSNMSNVKYIKLYTGGGHKAASAFHCCGSRKSLVKNDIRVFQTYKRKSANVVLKDFLKK